MIPSPDRHAPARLPCPLGPTTCQGRRPAAAGLLTLLLAAAVALAGCSGLTGPRESFTIYELTAPAGTVAQGPRVDWQLLIETPRASDLVASQRIIVAPDANERQVYKGARWAERTPELLQSLWLRAFEADGRVPGVARSGSGVRADLLLSSELTRFQASYIAGTPQAEVELHARLIDPRQRRIADRRVFRASVPADSSAIADVVSAFDQAMAQINPDLVNWAVTRGDQALAEARSDADTQVTAGEATASDAEPAPTLPIRRMRRQ